ncbi:tRNA methyltransferase 10 homolog B [Eurytemora carolleeae]|uniref:tRNA methyltransferase 10 homolog B n=1 Tax=Eurytemora carolleeae TaxID=1294199 RepID=UPI000C77C777|nr:tRNA methyltransferase 10 homolog B [Eurytemora carolleeae]|eukprot:XP_023335292.1 tRNA methyltransferase 10 homolog B-like [Eurytemora affinis]
MNEKEVNHLSNQLKRVYSANKTSERPFNLFFTNLQEDGLINRTCCAKVDGFRSYIINFKENPVTELFDSKDLVYLSPDAENTLQNLDPKKVYVIGGLVDDSVKSQVSLNLCQSLNLQCYKLPIDEFMERGETGTYKQILTINQIFEILLKFYETADWKQALAAGVPPRTGFIIKQ